MNWKLGALAFAAVILLGCDSRVHDPWVQYDEYQQAERSRSAQLDQQLDRRISEQRDR